MYGLNKRGVVWRIPAMLAIVAIALLGTVTGGLATDLGATCCGDLDERVAELEAATARKGNRAVSVRIYGQVNKALLAWDNGFSSDAAIVDNHTSTSRLGLRGQAEIKPGWRAGYRMEFDFADAVSDEVSGGKNGDEGFSSSAELRIRQNYWYVDSDNYGRLSVGQQSPATDDITIINLGAQMSNANLHYNSSFGVRFGPAFGLTTDLTWRDLAHTIDTVRGDFVRWDSPVLYGFMLSWAAGENDVYDVALRYSGEWNALRFAAGIGAMDAQETDFNDVRGSASLLHAPTGLYVAFAGVMRGDESGLTNGDAGLGYAQLGVKRRLWPYGSTTFYGEYGMYQDYAVGRLVQADIFAPGAFADGGQIRSSEVERWGLGVEQAVDSAGLLLYAQYQRFEGSIVGNPCGAPGDCTTVSGEFVALPVEPWQAVVLGARVQF